MAAHLQQILQRLAGALQQGNGGQVAQLLLLGNTAQLLPSLQDGGALTRACTQMIQTRPYDQIVACHFRSLYASASKQYAQAIQLETQAAELLYATLDGDRESNWFLPIVNVILRQLRVASYAADALLERQGEKTKHMIEVQDVLRRYLNRMVVDRAPLAQSKKMGCLFVIVHLFKLYFKLNNLKLCTFLIRMVPQLPPLEQFSKAQVIAYKYYLGRLHVFEEKYEEAEQCLAYAFAHCSRSSPGNKKRILQFLIPVRLLKAQYPLDLLLAKYGLLEFQKLILAIKRGDLESFNKNLQENQRFFIQKGIYLILEKLKIFVYRNLFRKVHLFHSQTSESNANQLPLETLLAALRVNGTDMSLDELECILANLIFQNNIKGYIAHKRCVVLSKADPFPKSGL